MGLLTLPEVFGDGPCHQFSPEEVPLFAEMGSEQSIGVIRVDRHWTFPESGGCEGLAVKVHRGARVSALPTEESDYEAPAAIVLEERKKWFKVRLADGAAWVRASEKNIYYSLEALLLSGLTYITEGGQLFSRPGGADAVAMAESGDPVRVAEVVGMDDRLWLHVQVLSHSPCESADEPRVLSQGWMPAHGLSGRPTAWFRSRGC